ILQRQRARDPRLGYAYDFVAMLGPVLPEIVRRGIRVVANAGGVHVEACRDRIAEACRAQGLTPALGMVSGDDLLPRPDQLVAAGTVAGHVLECGAQATGGNLTDWRKVAPLDVGYPIAEVAADGRFVVTKHPGTGGRVSRATVTEQLLYEIGDPARYLTPDVS